MGTLIGTPVERIVTDWWTRIDPAQKKGFFAAMVVSILAFGFEMTNLTLHHDDLVHLFVQAPLVGYYLGRFSYAGIFFYGLSGQFAPFLHMAIGMTVTAAYGLVVCRLWDVRSPLETGVITAVLCVFPYMAQIYQYNSAMVAFPLAHLLAALAVSLSVRASVRSVVLAAALYVGAFSIYQAVLANAAAIFILWALAHVLFRRNGEVTTYRPLLRPMAAALVAVFTGGVVYVTVVASMHIPFDSAQAANQAFSLSNRLERGFPIWQAVEAAIRGTRATLFWPEHYFPNLLKKLQLTLLVSAAVICVWLPRGARAKTAALLLLGIASLSPRVLQMLHPQGHFHSLTLTAYALVIAGALMIILRAGSVLVRNASAIVASLLIAGYVMQCNWISTVNYLNTLAHISTLTQMLATLRSLPDAGWDGKTVAVVGSYDMRSDFPFRPATGVATTFMNPGHMERLARLMRDEVRFIRADATLPKALEYARAHEPWPNPGSVGIVDGVGVVVLSKPDGNDVPAGSQ